MKASSSFPPEPLERFTDHVLSCTLFVGDTSSYKRLKEWYELNEGKKVDFEEAVRSFEEFVPEWNRARYFSEAAWFFLAEKDFKKANEYAGKALQEPGMDEYEREEALAVKNLTECILQNKSLPDLHELKFKGIPGIGSLIESESDLMEIHFYMGLRQILDYVKENFGLDYPDVRKEVMDGLKTIEFKMRDEKGIVFGSEWWKKSLR